MHQCKNMTLNACFFWQDMMLLNTIYIWAVNDIVKATLNSAVSKVKTLDSLWKYQTIKKTALHFSKLHIKWAHWVYSQLHFDPGESLRGENGSCRQLNWCSQICWRCGLRIPSGEGSWAIPITLLIDPSHVYCMFILTQLEHYYSTRRSHTLT